MKSNNVSAKIYVPVLLIVVLAVVLQFTQPSDDELRQMASNELVDWAKEQVKQKNPNLPTAMAGNIVEKLLRDNIDIEQSFLHKQVYITVDGNRQLAGYGLFNKFFKK